MSGSTGLDLLVLDFGGPVLLTPFELAHRLERRPHVAPGTFTGRGFLVEPVEPAFAEVLAGRASEPAYWEGWARQWAAPGEEPDVPAMMREIFAGPEEEWIRPEALDAVAAAHSVGARVAVLSNDLTAFHDDAWVRSVRFFDSLDALVDAERDGVRKPDAAAYELVCARAGVPVGRALLVDDQPPNVAGARAAGMAAVLFDPASPAASYAVALRLLGADAA